MTEKNHLTEQPASNIDRVIDWIKNNPRGAVIILGIIGLFVGAIVTAGESIEKRNEATKAESQYRPINSVDDMRQEIVGKSFCFRMQEIDHMTTIYKYDFTDTQILWSQRKIVGSDFQPIRALTWQTREGRYVDTGERYIDAFEPESSFYIRVYAGQGIDSARIHEWNEYQFGGICSVSDLTRPN